MEYKGFMGGFYKITEWIMRISGSNLLWLLCSSPFLFFLLTKLLLLQSPGAPQENLTLWAMGILAPFTLFPATAALFSVTRKWVMGEADLSIIKVYFKGYKENYKQSMLGGIFYTLLIVIMYVDYTVYMTQISNMQIIGMIMLFLLFLLLLSLFNFFSLVAHYHLGAFQLIKNAILFTIIRPFRTLSTLICVVVLGVLTMRFTWLILFGFGSLAALVAFYNFYIAYNKIQEKVEKMREAEEESNGINLSKTDDDLELNLPAGEDKEKD
ncbi:YesL family protein [Paenibacillus macerans]|uniref:YesL family protein n=1 Tax=Paenibacillus macerans TaxID=44252 RepID=UPI00203EDA88|nr:DUF624 domain-containing protein [Paenibacillus macerans]MCM3699844.1 DUF624 domain-containing protein [Paenibacillus macerans]